MTAPLRPEEQEKQLRDKCYKLLHTEAKLLQRWKEEDARHEARKADLQVQKDNTVNELNQYAQVACRNLCDKIFKVCPREIRDYIYAYLLPNSPVVLEHCDHRDCDSKPCAKGSETLYYFVEPYSHLFKTAYVIPEFSIELLEKYYRTSTFDLRDQFARLGAFRSLDRGNLGVIPANYILNVSLCIQCDKYDFDGVTAPLASLHRNYALKPRRALLADLEALFGFKAGTKIDLHLHVNRDWLLNAHVAEYWECDTVIPVILPTLRRLAAAGTKAKLCFDHFGWGVTIDHGDVTMEEIKSGLSKKIGK
ncbi:hypothetical protein J4E83_004192 [Alternaria metachromatica]|uniref:uncharacterized protein n=1 Tax=Alternaria metachromatica TaxID=283354 RepID=UPI0020C41B4E|nr:uncharacterized protein J4E83_004192 [Alternaria metachromatica]XP_049239589.1 uncharacterized protein J4E84_010083 [Alternaria hordeiaustralica]KAI4624517.1 hypothetical protein J4E83_004192 [Alternaria metachromatica]KAI4675341.1 hypothetical protein J4E84_010083 [Alternaria hordeiaustralica]